MELRDTIAIAAMQELIRKLPLFDREGQHGTKLSKLELHEVRTDIAESAYDYADAMIRWRAKPAGKEGE